MARHKGSVRTGQLITTYGIGSLVALDTESWVVAGLDSWNEGEPDIREPRLERELRVNGFRRPPATGEDKHEDVPVFRFPEWYYCPTCTELGPHSRFCERGEKHCARCVDAPALVASRFVMACPRGHIDEFPYMRWAHGGGNPGSQNHQLHFITRGASAALSDVEIKCGCGETETLEDAFKAKVFARISGGCTGKRPWLDDHEECGEDPIAIQRGASNGWYPVLRSAISIPPWSEAAFKVISKNWNLLRNISDEDLPKILGAVPELVGGEFEIEELVEVIRQRKRQEEGNETSTERLRDQEFEALRRGRTELTYMQDFVCVPAGVSDDVSSWFERVMLVTRLREVRALVAFTRLFEPGDEENYAALSRDESYFLPAVEVSGEGVFISLDQERLGTWEKHPDVRERVAALVTSQAKRSGSTGGEASNRITPRLVAVHTLAHVLIDQWALESGYGASALRERLFVSDEMAGLLIYTATSDSAGSLGGLVARGEPELFARSLQEAIRQVAWCSADPLCMETRNQGVDGMNMAACHACVLLPETSCEERNLLLDRALLVGTHEDPEFGLFSPLFS